MIRKKYYFSFIESIRSVASKTTPKTLERHGKLAGGVGKALEKMYGDMVKGEAPGPVRRSIDQRKEDIKFLTELLKKENLTKEINGRCHKSFPNICSRVAIDKDRFISKIKSLSKKLDKSKRVAV